MAVAAGEAAMVADRVRHLLDSMVHRPKGLMARQDPFLAARTRAPRSTAEAGLCASLFLERSIPQTDLPTYPHTSTSTR